MGGVIHSCPTCLRLHDGAGRLVPMRMVNPEITPCNQPDCAAAAEYRRNGAQTKRDRQRASFANHGAGMDKSLPNQDRE